ncbi:TlpA family protein disulfide reductase [Epilithonimonas arachidiradicis]|uniref:Thiol-disulfide isomerase/thioredoxin n=1 Tax=Epilithonimonas arachidiradicis TaxID=1617282 RepID=A0A420DDF5_9FLAO|nr:TlpA disulfide reductase family protein [Epilithonimonas arachidiradicis]RKE89813.1 thiol-disulfide isomerase/thioredoxin [Epilithonimonas arachidiradicis]GGG45516.1 thiol:disulfide interchange protein [Epilithonimonas arachidiradicis]
MKTLVKFLLLIFPFLINAQIQTDVSLIKYEDLEKRIPQEKDKFVVVNFWATTCAPCVKELPHFIEVNKKYSQNPNFKMLLVSLDMARDKQKVINFIKTKNLTAEVVILDDNKRMNTWIPKFQKDWEGEIPVTFFYKNGEKVFFNNGEMSLEELESAINKNYNP